MQVRLFNSWLSAGNESVLCEPVARAVALPAAGGFFNAVWKANDINTSLHFVCLFETQTSLLRSLGPAILTMTAIAVPECDGITWT